MSYRKRARNSGTIVRERIVVGGGGRSSGNTPFMGRNKRTGGFIGKELKFYDTNLNATALASSGGWTGCEYDPSATSMISTPTQGDSAQQRDGRKIWIKSVMVRGTIDFPALINQAAVPAGEQCMIALVLDMQTNAAQLNSEDVYTAPGASNALNTQPLRDLEFGPRFKTLKAKHYTVRPGVVSYDGTNIEVGGTQVPFEFYIKNLNLKVNFNSGTTASIANVVDNSLHIIANTTNAVRVPTIQYSARIRFYG